MDGNRLERVTPDGFYYCSLTPSRKGRNIIEGIPFEITWRRPIPSNGTLMNKMVNECHLYGEEILKKGILPLSIHSAGLEDGQITCTAYERDERPYRYFVKMKLLEGTDKYLADWKVLPDEPDEGDLLKMVEEASATAEFYRKKGGAFPSRVEASLRLGSREVYSFAW